MKNKVVSLTMIILFGIFACAEVSANDIPALNGMVINPTVYLDNAIDSINSTALSVKSGSYKESEDPLMRRGTQNTDSPQGMFFILPFVLTALFFVVLFFNKKKK